MDTINFDRHTRIFIPRKGNFSGGGQKPSSNTTFSINVVQSEGPDVYLYNSSTTTFENGEATTMTSTIELHPNNPKAQAGVTKGLNLYFDGLITTNRKNYDWESVGKFMNLDRGFYDYMIARNPNAAGWRAKALSIEAMEGVMPVLVSSGLGGWAGVRYAATSSALTMEVSSLRPTHYLTKSKKEMQAFVDQVRANGITESIKYVEVNGVKYIVDGHHRYFTAHKLGIKNVPVEQVQLPYGSYKTASDLMLEGKMPGYWNYIK